MPWSRYQPHGFILSYRYIPVNRIRRFYGMFVWMWRAAFCIPFETCTSCSVSIEAFCVISRLLFDAERQTGRLAVSCVPIPPGRDRHLCVLAALFGYLPLWVHFGFVRLFVAISTGLPGMRGTENGGRGWRRGLCASLRNRIGLVSFSAGSTLGLRAPDCAKESSTLWTLFRGWPSGKVRFALVRIRAVARVHGKT